MFSAAPADTLCGEITPGYARISETTASRMAFELPGVQVVVFLRHPVERRWSTMVKSLARDRGRRVEDVTEAEWLASAHLDVHLDVVLRTWWDLVGTERVHLAWFDELVSGPDEHLGGVLRFLGVDEPPGALTAGISGPVNAASTGASPPSAAVRERLASLAGDDLDRLAALLPDSPWPRIWQSRPAGRW